MKFFVYGTLMRKMESGMASYIEDNGGIFIGEGFVEGRLFDVGWFPAFTPSEDGYVVKGEVWEVDDDYEHVLSHMDAYEGYNEHDVFNSLYVRENITVVANGFPLRAFIYIFNDNTNGLKEIYGGDYAEYVQSGR